jgi:hypothetical protein
LNFESGGRMADYKITGRLRGFARSRVSKQYARLTPDERLRMFVESEGALAAIVVRSDNSIGITSQMTPEAHAADLNLTATEVRARGTGIPDSHPK